jgi:hypothetical protein
MWARRLSTKVTKVRNSYFRRNELSEPSRWRESGGSKTIGMPASREQWESIRAAASESQWEAQWKSMFRYVRVPENNEESSNLRVNFLGEVINPDEVAKVSDEANLLAKVVQLITQFRRTGHVAASGPGLCTLRQRLGECEPGRRRRAAQLNSTTHCTSCTRHRGPLRHSASIP